MSSLSRTKSFSGVVQPDARTKYNAGGRRNMASSGTRKGAAKARRKTGMAKTRKAKVSSMTQKQVYDLASKAALDLQETKYFNVEADKKWGPYVPVGTNRTKKLSVMGFSNTIDTDDTGAAVNYGGVQVHPLYMLNPFKSNNTDPHLAAQAISGSHVLPYRPQMQFIVERNAVNIAGQMFAKPAPDGGPAGSPNSETYRCLPICCRIVRVTPKLRAGTSTFADAELDLFLDQYGQEVGVQSAGTNTSDPKLLSRIDIEYAAVNTRKWTVLNDTKFDLQSPPVISKYTASNPPSGGWGSWLLDNPTTSDASTCKNIVYETQLAQKKGGAVFFEKPDANTTINASAMQRREYVFMHFWFVSSDHLEHVDCQPDDLDMNVRTRTLSMFKDV